MEDAADAANAELHLRCNDYRLGPSQAERDILVAETGSPSATTDAALPQVIHTITAGQKPAAVSIPATPPTLGCAHPISGFENSESSVAATFPPATGLTSHQMVQRLRIEYGVRSH